MYTDELQKDDKRGTRGKSTNAARYLPTNYAYNIASCPPCRIFDGHRFGKFMNPFLVLEFLWTKRLLATAPWLPNMEHRCGRRSCRGGGGVVTSHWRMGHDPSCPHGLKDSKILRETLQRKGGPSSTVLTRWRPTTGQMVETSEDERGDM